MAANMMNQIRPDRRITRAMAKESEAGRVGPCVILLNGYPGVGKSTIARALRSSFATERPCRIVQHQLIFELSQAIDPGKQRMRDHIRDVTLKALSGVKGDMAIIMTDTLLFTDQGNKDYTKYALLARERGIPLFAINLLCNAKTNAERLCSGSQEAGKTHPYMKSVDAKALAEFRKKHQLFDAKVEAKKKKIKRNIRGNLYLDVKDKIFSFNLDITEATVEYAVDRIRTFMLNPF